VDIGVIWDRIEGALAAVGPERVLPPPATPEQLAEAEAVFGGPLSPVIRGLYCRHDGTIPDVGLDLDLLSLADAAARHHPGEPWPVVPGEMLSDDSLVEYFEERASELEESPVGWHPDRSVCPIGEVPDERALIDAIDRMHGDGSERLTSAAEWITVVLAKRGRFAADPLGTFDVEDGPTRRIVVFRASPETAAAMNGGALPTACTEGEQLYAAIAAAVARWSGQTPVVWPGLGEFAFTNRRSFRGHDPETGAPMDVPARRILTFRAWSALYTRLNTPPQE
jgi:nucleoid DNA-binding protein